MSTNDPNYPPRRPGTGGSGTWIIGLIVLIAIGIGVWFWAGWYGTGPRTAAIPAGPAVTGPATTGAGPVTPPPANNNMPATNGSAPANNNAPANANPPAAGSGAK